jgi:hypothetical protein
MGDNAIAVRFEFVDPFGAGRDLAREDRLTGRTKPAGWRRASARILRHGRKI